MADSITLTYYDSNLLSGSSDLFRNEMKSYLSIVPDEDGERYGDGGLIGTLAVNEYIGRYDAGDPATAIYYQYESPSETVRTATDDTLFNSIQYLIYYIRKIFTMPNHHQEQRHHQECYMTIFLDLLHEELLRRS